MPSQAPSVVLGGEYQSGDKLYCLLDVVNDGDTQKMIALCECIHTQSMYAQDLSAFLNVFSHTGRRIETSAGIMLIKAREDGDAIYLEDLVCNQFKRTPLIALERFFFSDLENFEHGEVFMSVRFTDSGGVLSFPLSQAWLQPGMSAQNVLEVDIPRARASLRFLGEVDGWTVARVKLRP